MTAAEQETNTEPTEAQKEAGNYKKGHVKIDGYNITIENPKGSERSGQDKDGKKWSITMNNTYGYILGTEGVDGDHIDVFLSDNPSEGNVYVVDQVNADGSFDEHKVMYGFPDIESARKAYLSNYEEGWQGLGNITGVSKEEFKKWVDSSHRKTKPFAEYSSVKPLGDTIPDSNVTASVNKLNETNNDEQPQSKLAEYRTEYPGRVFGEQHEDGSVTFHDEDAMLVSELLGREFDGEDLTLPKKEADKALQKLLANGHKVAYYGDEYKPKYDEHGNLIEQNTDPQPIGKGMFGNIHDQFKGKAKEEVLPYNKENSERLSLESEKNADNSAVGYSVTLESKDGTLQRSIFYDGRLIAIQWQSGERIDSIHDILRSAYNDAPAMNYDLYVPMKVGAN